MPSVRLVLFCYPVSPTQSDPTHVKKRLILMYGEGYYTTDNLQVSFNRADKRGVYIIKWTGDYDKISRDLQAEHIDDESKGIRLKTGLLLRPPIIAAIENGLPFPLNSLIHQYACLDKGSVLQEIWGGEQDPSKRLTLVDEALDKIGEVSGRAFRRGEHHLLGDVFLVDRPRDSVLPVTWQHEQTEDGGIAVHLDVDPALMIASQAVINLRVTGLDSYVIDDRAVLWSREGGTRLTVRFNQAFSGVELKIWVEQRLRWEVHYVVQSSMMLNFQNVHGTEHIRDRLTERAAKAHRGTKQGKKGTGTVASSIMKYGTGMQSLIGNNEKSPWDVAAASARTLPVSLFRPAPPRGTLFREGQEGRLGLVEAIGARISEGSRAILLDPFFDDIGAETLLGRIGNQSVDFTIVTSLPTGVSPLSFDRLNQFLRANEHTIRPNTRIYRLIKGSLPYFHDRHLIIFGEFPQPRVFNFTNSVSGLALNYTLSVNELRAPRDRDREIHGIVTGHSRPS